MTNRQPHFENRFRKHQAIAGWVVVGLWLLTAALTLVAVANGSRPAGQRWVTNGEKLGAPALVAGILALAAPIAYFMIRAEAKRADALAAQFRSGRHLARWVVPPDLAKRFRTYARHGRGGKASDEVQVFVGHGGAYIDGQYFLWNTAARRLTAVSVVAPPGIGLTLLEFKVDVNGHEKVAEAPLPPGAEVAAQRLAEAVLRGDGGGGGWATAVGSIGNGLADLFR